ncbi:hypothetical protein A6764_18405 [Brevibacillus sp. WF146]|uniref:hypothetical protein n=1 Tax=Brevibacillus sp. WF146 TaxID=319501 RepID=UPI0007EE1CCF|nr:hypothetical protein [Brevibacillus sp. WF146]UYZ12754.1 hypothetical protein A6764_18405 [Brevibacillus sp. WF146]
MQPARFLYLLLCLAAGLLVGFSSPDKGKKATWIWQAELIDTQRHEILDFAKSQGINLIYLRIDREKPFDYYRPFIREARLAGIDVHALGGHPRWALAVDRERMLGLVDWVKRYNRSVDQEERIRGVHLDIEPYLLDEWYDDQPAVLKQWMGNIEAFVAAAREEDGLEVGTDLAVWFDHTPVPGQAGTPFSTWMIDTFDHVTLMAYRDTVDGPNGIEALVKDELEAADALGKQVIIAVNTKEMPHDPHTSFFEEGAEAMDAQLAEVTSRLGGHSSFGGVAVHDYRHWQNLRKPTDTTAKPVLGTYVWHAEHAITEGDEILAFAKEQGINLLYVRLDLQQPYEAYADFVEKATAAGIEVHAMGGHPIWALEQYRERMLKLVRYVKDYNRNVAPNQQFRGIHLDIEPYVMPVWRQDTNDVLRQWMGNLDAFVEETKRESNLETSCDLAVWLDQFDVPDEPGTSFSKWVIDRLDHVTLMAFRDYAEGPGGIAAVAKDEMMFADELDKKLIIAVEMKESGEGEHITFFEEGKAEMMRQLAKLPRLLSEHPSYKGNAVHAYEYWKTAKE